MQRTIFPALAGLLFLAGIGCGETPDPGDDDDASPATTDQDQDGFAAGTDCNDADATVYPGATESCNGVDDNCSGQTDEGLTVNTYYQDSDGDGYGDPGASSQGCSAPSGYVTTSTDCNDTNASIRPGGTEITCNGIDESCTSLVADHLDGDGDGYDICGPGVSGADGNPIDCSDADPQVNPGVVEACNESDDNCNGQVDEGVTATTYYQDADLDGYGDPDEALEACTQPAGYASEGGDCNDSNAEAYPDAPETSGDGIDTNCDSYADTILSYAGTGTAGLSGDNSGATAAQLNLPYAVSIDQRGDFFIADTENNRIRKVTAEGVISTYAGAGTAGDGSQAYTASLISPYGVTADGAGNVFIADSGRNVIRKVNPNGIISTVVGSGKTDDGVGGVGDGGAPTQGHLDFPTSLAMDLAGNLYIADTNHHRVRMVSFKPANPQNPQGPNIITVSGSGVEGGTGDNGPAVAAQLSKPRGVHIDTAGNLYIADTGNHKIRKVNVTAKISTVAGTGVAGFGGDGAGPTNAQLNGPTSIATDITATTLYIADTQNNRIRKVFFGPPQTGGGIISTIAGTGATGSGGDGANAAQAQLNHPYGIAIGVQGNLAIADTNNHRVRIVVW